MDGLLSWSKFVRRQCYALALIALVSSCQSEWSPEAERFTQTYAEILVARELYPDTAQSNRQVQELLRQHGYSSEQEFREAFLRFAQDPELIRRIFDSALARSQRMLADSLRQRSQ